MESYWPLVRLCWLCGALVTMLVLSYIYESQELDIRPEWLVPILLWLCVVIWPILLIAIAMVLIKVYVFSLCINKTDADEDEEMDELDVVSTKTSV